MNAGSNERVVFRRSRVITTRDNTSAAAPRRPSRRALAPNAGSVGEVETRYVTFGSAEQPLFLERGGQLGPVTIAYETYGTLAPDGGNAILACHALSGDAHAAGWSTEANAPSAVDGMGADDKGIVARGGLGWWDGMIGPGKAFDTRHWEQGKLNFGNIKMLAVNDALIILLAF